MTKKMGVIVFASIGVVLLFLGFYPAMFQKIVIEPPLLILRGVLGLFQDSYRATSSFWDKYSHLMQAQKENRILRHEVLLLSTRLEKAESLLVENERLRALLELKKRVGSKGLACRLLADNPTIGHRTLLVDCGRNQGVHRKDGVMGPQGVVGFVVKVFPDFSQVLWLEDPFFAMEGLLPGSVQKGVLHGMGVGRPMEMDYVPAMTPVQKGQAVVTSGEDGFFPPGEAIGFVKDIRTSPGLLFKNLDVVAAENFSDLSVVYVMIPPRQWVRSSLKWKRSK
uniref:Cell shape-determining protein MreC n=1 Tax=Leptospirillum ferriphilum TaxID=178606 RepID=A0A7C3QVB7_9BACT